MATWNGTPGAGCARVSYAVASLLRRTPRPSRGSLAAWLAIEAVSRRRKSTILLQLLEYGRLAKDAVLFDRCCSEIACAAQENAMTCVFIFCI